MSVEDNVKLSTAFEAAFNARDWKALASTLAESVVVHDPANPVPTQGRETVLEMFRTYADHFPTAKIEGVRRFGQGKWICIQNVETGSRKDEGRGYRISTCYVLKVENNRLAELRFYYDALGMMTQMGMSLSQKPDERG